MAFQGRRLSSDLPPVATSAAANQRRHLRRSAPLPCDQGRGAIDTADQRLASARELRHIQVDTLCRNNQIMQVCLNVHGAPFSSNWASRKTDQSPPSDAE